MLTQSIANYANIILSLPTRAQMGYSLGVETVTASKRKPLVKRERGVGIRLREAREVLRLSQQEFAAQVGISRQRLASYEELRAPIRFDLALKICRQFVISEKYLATGKGPARECYDLFSESASHQVPLDMPFAQAYDLRLGAIYEELKSQLGGKTQLTLHEGDSLDLVKNWFLFTVELWFGIDKKRSLPKGFSAGLFEFLLKNGNMYVEFAVKNNKLPTLDDFEVVSEIKRKR